MKRTFRLITAPTVMVLIMLAAACSRLPHEQDNDGQKELKQQEKALTNSPEPINDLKPIKPKA